MEQPIAQPESSSDRPDGPPRNPHEDPEVTVDAVEEKVSSEYPDHADQSQNLPEPVRLSRRFDPTTNPAT